MPAEARKPLPMNSRYSSDRSRCIRAEVSTVDKAAYRAFVKMWPSFRPDTYTWNDFRVMLGTINDFYIDYAIDTGNFIRIPCGLGVLGIRKYKHPPFIRKNGKLNQIVDWNMSKKVKKTCYYTNEHTDGYQFRWWWLKDKLGMPNPRMWKMKMLDDASEKVSRYIKGGGDWQKFHQCTNRINEQNIRRRIKREEKARRDAS